LVEIPLFLASASPRRREFLDRLGLVFSARAVSINETPLSGEGPEEYVQRLSRLKAEKCAAGVSRGIIIGADTIVVLDGELLGKPQDRPDAFDMLCRLRGRPHQVLSSLTLYVQPEYRVMTRINTTTVWMRGYSDAEIAAYVESGDALDKAGAYAVQSRSFSPVDRVEGCVASVMGFPLGDFQDMLADLGGPLIPNIPAICRELSGYPCCLD
jgi:septum formation protein